MLKRCVLICVVAVLAAAADDVVINEVLSSSAGALLDEDGDASDWVELLNRGGQGVSLAGWGLSDRVGNPMKWVMPDVSLGAGERRLVFASGKDRTNVLAAALSSPQEVPGLVLWLRAEGMPLNHNDPVAAWSDLSGCGNHATQASSGARPVFVANAVNGLPAVRFTRSSSQQLLLPHTAFNGMESLRDFSLFIVCRWSGGSTPSGLFGAWGSSANSHFEVNNSGGALRLRVANMNDINSGGVMTASVWCQVAGLMNSSGDAPIARIFRDGVLRGEKSQNPGGAALSGHTTMALGCSDSGRNFNGDIAEVLMFNRALRPSERSAVERLLAVRYGLPLGGMEEPELHANFSISASGETVVLTRADGMTIDSVAVPPLPRGVSYGRSPDGVGGFAYFAEPTPNAPNTTAAYEPPAASPSFSHVRGIYEQPFSLTLGHDDPGASLYYTLDGSEPSAVHGTLYAAPIAVTNTTVVRAVARKPGALPVRDIATHTYLFLGSVVAQTNRPPAYPANWGSFANTSYAISPYIASQPGYAEALRDALRAIPVLSVSASIDDLFGSGGVYANPTVDGLERAVSAEWITNGVSQLQIDAGLRAQGGASRQFGNSPKKSLRLLFKSAYGEGRLREPVLADGGTALANFNTLILRAEYNNSWVHNESFQRAYAVYVRDQWVRNMQVAMSGSGSHGTHVHLFLNGLYWGLYNVAERPDAAFASTVFGGARADYDTMVPQGIRDGDNIAWNTMHALAKAGLAAPAQYEGIQQYLNVEHLIDYMILNFYAGNDDWPHHNWSGVRRRETGAGFLFYVWDAERTLEGVNVNRVSATHTSGPAYLHTALCANPEYRLRFADRIHRHLYNDGALTAANTAATFATLAATIEPAVYGESARWGAYRNALAPYGTNHWTAERSRLLTTYFPQRTAVMTNQFRAANLYPTLAAPEFSQHGGVVEPAATVALSAPQGGIYVTFDNTDPREPYTSAVAATAAAYAAPFAVTDKMTVKARALHNGVWSALTEAAFSPPNPYLAIRVTKLMFAPPGPTPAELAAFPTRINDHYAWLELSNTGAAPLNLSGYTVSNNIQCVFGNVTLAPGDRYLVTKSKDCFDFRYPEGAPPNDTGRARKNWDSGNIARNGGPDKAFDFYDPGGSFLYTFTYTSAWFNAEAKDTGRWIELADRQCDFAVMSTEAGWTLSDPGAPPRIHALTLQGDALTFAADGLGWGRKLLWSIDLETWHEYPPGAVTIDNGTARAPLPEEALTAQRCFFKIANP
ncbi:MAG: CotH kinase family protein [Kiritimatiellaeota bacterium]|nr:CotH kinase family protein [Kiritimatiellota bacterium]